VELRLGDTAILAGDVPDFLGIADENGAGSGAVASAVGVKRLRVTADGGDAKGVITVTYVNRPQVQVEALRIECLALGSAGDVFTVVAIDSEGAETELGSMTSRTRYAVAVLALSSRRGDTIPGGGVLALGGQKVEVRDAGGTAWLAARFPALDAE
jgi:hypothetical protein